MILGDPLEINKEYNITGNGRYIIERDNNNTSCYYYDFDDTYQGIVEFTRIDRINYIISGKFEFSTKSDGCEDINITEGRFDMKYIP